MFRPDGRSDFGALRIKAGGAQACLVAFDLLTLDAEDVRLRPIEERRDKLSGLVRGPDGVVFSEAIEAEGAVVFAHACKLGLEGIASERAGRPLSERDKPQLAEVEEPGVREDVTPCPATARSSCPSFIIPRCRSSASRAAVAGATHGTARRHQADRSASDARQLPESAVRQYPRSVQGGIRAAVAVSDLQPVRSPPPRRLPPRTELSRPRAARS